MAKLLIVEDDRALSTVMKAWLELARHLVEVTHTCSDALALLNHYHFDALVLDLGLPDMDGLNVLTELRAKGANIPTLILTAKDQIGDKERGFDAGADDYLTKPFDMRELSLRLGALLRRSPSLQSKVMKCGDLELDTATKKVTKAGQILDLRPIEYSLLEFFMRFPSHVFTTDDLLNYVWKSDSTATAIGVRTCIARLRKKLGGDESNSLIATVYKQGYRFDPGKLECSN
jgi:DNA-binding response OmpR family regulator